MKKTFFKGKTITVFIQTAMLLALILNMGSAGFLTSISSANASSDHHHGDNHDNADLSITKKDNIDPVKINERMIYTLTITNSGQDSAKNVIVTDNFPNGFYVEVADPSQGNCDESMPRKIVCSLGKINKDSNVTIEISGYYTIKGTFINTAVVDSDTKDNNKSNNSDSERTRVACGAYCGDGQVNQDSEQCEGQATAECMTESGAPGIRSCISGQCQWSSCIPNAECGNGVIDDGEQCDKTAGVGSGQTCSDNCMLIDNPFCGDGLVNQDIEQCEGESSQACVTAAGYQGNQNCNSGQCTWNDCSTEQYCGDGTVNGQEKCDFNDPYSIPVGQICNKSCTLQSISTTGSITICKYEDTNTNHTYDQGVDLPLQWSFTMTSLNGQNQGEIWHTETNSDTGCVTLNELNFGDYQVVEATSTGWVQSLPANGEMTVNINQENTSVTASFLNYREQNCQNGSIVLDSVPSESLSSWTDGNFGGNPIFSYSEITSPYDGSTALHTSVVGNTLMECYNQYLKKTYFVEGNSQTSDLKAYLEFVSSMDQYNFPYIYVIFYDSADNYVGQQYFYGNGVIGSHYAGLAAASPSYYTELSAASGDLTMDLSNLGNVNFSRIDVYVSNYACMGTNSITFDQLRLVTDCPAQPVCGDGVINQTSEQCDGQAGERPSNYTCSTACQLQCVSDCGGSSTSGFSSPSAVILTTSNNPASPPSSPNAPAPSNPQQEVAGEKLSPKLEITKDVSNEKVWSGDTLEYSIVVTNSGNLIAYDVKISDKLPKGLSFVDTDGKWNIGNLNPKDTKTIKYKVKVGNDVNEGKYKNIVTAEALNNGPVSAEKEIDVMKPEVLGIKLPSTGFSNTELEALLGIIALLVLASIFAKKYSNKIA
jgi:uncharacterized repeat protein (TIGR01451 family)